MKKVDNFYFVHLGCLIGGPCTRGRREKRREPRGRAQVETKCLGLKKIFVKNRRDFA